MRKERSGLRAATLVLSLLFLNACVHQSILVSPEAIHQHIPELRSRGKALVETADGTPYELAADQIIDGYDHSVRVRDLIDGCRTEASLEQAQPDQEAGSCRLLQTRAAYLPVGETSRPDWSVLAAIGGAVLLVVGVGLIIGLVADCGRLGGNCSAPHP